MKFKKWWVTLYLKHRFRFWTYRPECSEFNFSMAPLPQRMKEQGRPGTCFSVFQHFWVCCSVVMESILNHHLLKASDNPRLFTQRECDSPSLPKLTVFLAFPPRTLLSCSSHMMSTCCHTPFIPPCFLLVFATYSHHLLHKVKVSFGAHVITLPPMYHLSCCGYPLNPGALGSWRLFLLTVSLSKSCHPSWPLDCSYVQKVLDLWWLDLSSFNLMMMWKQYTFSRLYYESRSFARLAICCTILFLMLGSGVKSCSSLSAGRSWGWATDMCNILCS